MQHDDANDADEGFDYDFGYLTAFVGLGFVAVLILVMFLTSGQV